MANFDPAQIRNPSTDRHKIWNRWLRPRDDLLCKISCKSDHWELLGKWVKYNENFSPIYIFFVVDQPTGLTARRIFTRDGSDNAASRKGQTFSGTEIRSPEKSPQSRKFGPKTDRNFRPKTLLYKNFTYKRPLIVIVGP